MERKEFYARLARLSPREMEIARLMACGKSNAQIANQLPRHDGHGHIITGTAKGYVRSLLGKLGLDSRLEVAVLWERCLVPADYSVAAFWTRRIGTPLIYSAQRTVRLNSEAGIVQDPQAESRIGPWPALPGAESLRARRAPSDFVTWYDEVAEAWISVRSPDPQISAVEVGASLYA